MIKLYGSPLSHYARKVRILLDLYGLPYTFEEVGEVSGTSEQAFANNPLMKVPTFVDGDLWMIESDHIANYLVGKYDPADRYHVQTTDVPTLNARAVLNGIMQEEVKLILAHRTGIPTEQYTFFEKSRKAVEQGLRWLEAHAELFDAAKPKYLDFHLVCLWEHLACYKFSTLDYSKLREIAESIGRLPELEKTSPYRIKKKLA